MDSDLIELASPTELVVNVMSGTKSSNDMELSDTNIMSKTDPTHGEEGEGSAVEPVDSSVRMSMASQCRRMLVRQLSLNH